MMKALIAKKKKAIKTEAVKYLYAPQYSSLSLQKVLEFAGQFEEVAEYFPDDRDIPMLAR